MMEIAGAAITVIYTCSYGHKNMWCNSSKSRFKKKQISTINITVAGYLFMSGLQFKVFKARHF